MTRTGGFLRASDLAGYEPRVAEPLSIKYRGLELAFSPGATGGPTAVQFRAEIFNLFNHPNLSNPGTDPNNQLTFGRITGKAFGGSANSCLADSTSTSAGPSC